MTTLQILNYQVFTDKLSSIDLSKKHVINTINQYSYCIAKSDKTFQNALKKSDILLPDGIGITMAGLLFQGKKIKKIAGADIHRHLLESLDKKGGSCFYLGASEKTLAKIKARLNKEYKNIKVGTYSPPFKPEFSPEESSEMVRQVNNFNPDVVFIGMTAPKQEKWAMDNSSSINANIICSIGAVFDFYAGTVARPNQIWINMGLEWFVRLIKEPKRMWKRYVYYGPAFIWYVLEEKFLKQTTV